jgi:hypothetical protein
LVIVITSLGHATLLTVRKGWSSAVCFECETLLMVCMQGLEADWSALADTLKGSHVTVAKYQADVDRDFANANLGLKTFPTIVYFPKVGSGAYLNRPNQRVSTCLLPTLLYVA